MVWAWEWVLVLAQVLEEAWAMGLALVWELAWAQASA
jgi:hypothetical protein